MSKNEDLNLLNTDSISGDIGSFQSIQKEFSDLWSGDLANSVNSSFNEINSSLNSLNEKVAEFNKAISKLNEYIDNLKTIESLEISMPKINTDDADKKDAISNDYSSKQSQINSLKERNESLKNEINGICSSISNPIENIKGNNVIAHRGYHPGGTRENSIDSFREAGLAGFWGCETDVRFDSAGRLVCSHNSVTQGQNPPSFEEYLDICTEYGMTPIIDLKDEKYGEEGSLSSQVVETIKRKGLIDNCIIQTDRINDIINIRTNSADARIWYLKQKGASLGLDLVQNYGVEAVNLRASDVNMNEVKSVVATGADACVWGVTSERGKTTYENWGAKYIMTDELIGLNH